MPVADFTVAFLVQRNAGSVVIRLTDTGTGFSSFVGNFSITYPDGSVNANTDYSSPDISSAGGTVDYTLKVNADNSPLTGNYTILYNCIESDVVYPESKTFNFTWVEPDPSLTNTSDVSVPKVSFKDNTDYDQGNFSEVYNTWTIAADMPSTSDGSGNTPSHAASLGDTELDAAYLTNYYEGVYATTLTLDITSTHTTDTFLSVNYTKVVTENFTINKTPTRTELIGYMNSYKDQISVAEKEDYDYAAALYFTILERSLTGVSDTSDELLELLEILNITYDDSYQAGAISAFNIVFAEITGTGTLGSIPVFSGANTLTDSIMSESGSTISVAGAISATTSITAPTIVASTSISTPTLTIGADSIAEYIQDTVGALLDDANGITWTYDDVTPGLSFDLALAASKITSGTFADARIGETSVTQHEAALSIAVTQLTGDMPDARIIASNVIQHQASLSITESQISDLGTYQPTSEKGNANGYAGLDSGGKVPAAQLPVNIMQYQGTWNASTNTPTLIDGTGDSGDVYIVSVAGSQDLGSGSITFAVGDWALYNGTTWEKVDNTDAVSTVHGRTGAVVAAASDYDADQIDFTPAGTIVATDVQAAIEELDGDILRAGDIETVTAVWNFSNGLNIGTNGLLDVYSGDMNVRSDNGMRFIIDRDNNGTGHDFNWDKDGEEGSQTVLMKLDGDTGVLENSNGISFNGGTDVLGDYEIGSWTVTMYDAQSGGNSNVGGGSSHGNYIRIGNACFVEIYLVVDITGFPGTGTLHVNLPFTAKSTIDFQTFGASETNGVNYDSTVYSITPSAIGGTDRARFVESGNNITATLVRINQCSTNNEFRFQGFYIID